MEINNEQFCIKYSVERYYIFVESFSIHFNHRNKKLSYKIFNDLQQEHNLPIILNCFHTLIPYYKKLGFKIDDQWDEEYFQMSKQLKGN